MAPKVARITDAPTSVTTRRPSSGITSAIVLVDGVRTSMSSAVGQCSSRVRLRHWLKGSMRRQSERRASSATPMPSNPAGKLKKSSWMQGADRPSFSYGRHEMASFPVALSCTDSEKPGWAAHAALARRQDRTPG